MREHRYNSACDLITARLSKSGMGRRCVRMCLHKRQHLILQHACLAHSLEGVEWESFEKLHLGFFFTPRVADVRRR